MPGALKQAGPGYNWSAVASMSFLIGDMASTAQVGFTGDRK